MMEVVLPKGIAYLLATAVVRLICVYLSNLEITRDMSFLVFFIVCVFINIFSIIHSYMNIVDLKKTNDVLTYVLFLFMRYVFLIIKYSTQGGSPQVYYMAGIRSYVVVNTIINTNYCNHVTN